MSDNLLAISDRKEALSRVYVHAVATQAGYACETVGMDRAGVDLWIQAGREEFPTLSLQLKATINLRASSNGHFRFPLKRRNYDLLRIATQTPRLLVVLDLPKDERLWMTITADELILRHRAYWLNLKGAQESSNKASVTVRIPEGNLFTVDSLRDLMEQSRKGSIQ